MSDREAFEKWYMSRGWVETYDPLMKHGHGGYIVQETCEAWQAWQAAQAQAQAGGGVNQQLLDALQDLLTTLQAVRELEVATHTKSGATLKQQRAAWIPVNDATTKAKAAIAAAQEHGK